METSSAPQLWMPYSKDSHKKKLKNLPCIQKVKVFPKNGCLTINYQKSKTYSHRETIFPSQSIPHLDQVELDLAPLGAPPKVA